MEEDQKFNSPGPGQVLIIGGQNYDAITKMLAKAGHPTIVESGLPDNYWPPLPFENPIPFEITHQVYHDWDNPNDYKIGDKIGVRKEITKDQLKKKRVKNKQARKARKKSRK